MAQSKDHPSLKFVQARGYTSGRPDGPPLWIVWHDMEASETPSRAENTAAYFANPGDGRDVSSHYTADSDSVVQCVRLADSAWTVGNRQGNYRGINVELSGFVSQSRAQWLDPFGRAMFAKLAPYIASDMKRFHIPNRWCTFDDLRAYRGGHTTHLDMGAVFGGTDHNDPGPGFPRDFVLAVITAALNGDDDMALKDDPAWTAFQAEWTKLQTDVDYAIWRLHALAGDLPKVAGGLGKGAAVAVNVHQEQDRTAAAKVGKGVAELIARPAVDPAVLAAAIVAHLSEGADGQTLTMAQVEAAVVAAFSRGLNAPPPDAP